MIRTYPLLCRRRNVEPNVTVLAELEDIGVGLARREFTIIVWHIDAVTTVFFHIVNDGTRL